jgi:hypothetical protein
LGIAAGAGTDDASTAKLVAICTGEKALELAD